MDDLKLRDLPACASASVFQVLRLKMDDAVFRFCWTIWIHLKEYCCGLFQKLDNKKVVS